MSVGRTRDKPGEQQCLLRRVHPHRGLVTRWAAGKSTSIGQPRMPIQWKLPKDDDFHLLISPHERTPATVMSTADSEQRIASTKIVMPSSSSFFDKHFCEFKATLKNFETCVSSWTWVTCQTLAHSYIVQINRNRCGWCKWKSVRGKTITQGTIKTFCWWVHLY